MKTSDWNTLQAIRVQRLHRARKSRSLAVMKTRHAPLLVAPLLAPPLLAVAALLLTAAAPTPTDIESAAPPAAWAPIAPDDLVVFETPRGAFIMQLAPQFAPAHVAAIRALVRRGAFGGGSVVRVQDNYVVQWADPNAERPDRARKVQHAQTTLPAEFEQQLDPKLPFTRLPDGDVYAREVGFVNGFPVGRDKRTGKMWLVHTYGMVGAGRDTAPDSGGGTELYAVIGQAPRHLDRNVTLFGRIVQGAALLSALPRGSGALGFYEQPEQMTPIKSIRVAADVPPAERTELEVLRTDTRTFNAWLESRRSRREEWFQFAAGRIDVCNVPVPGRPKSVVNK